MSAHSDEVGTVVKGIYNIVTAIKLLHQEEHEKEQSARLLVYKILSIHPAVDSMRPPMGTGGDLDWYTELRSPFMVFRLGIFRRLAQNEHFKRTSLLGETGTKARIMMLLLWIIGHRLSTDHVNKLLSTAVGDAMSQSAGDGDADIMPELQGLDSVKKILSELAGMFKTKLPLPPDRNPFIGDDYRREDEDRPLPSEELWGTGLAPEEQYRYDVRHNPSILLRPLKSRIIIPQTKLTLLLIQWVTLNFGLGKKVYRREDVDTNAFWNADPPHPPSAGLPSPRSISISPLSPGIDKGLGYPPQPPKSTQTPLEDLSQSLPDTFSPYLAAIQQLPLEDWLHLRYCSVYKVHGWLHTSFARTLLFNMFRSTKRFPSHSDVMSALLIARRLSTQYSEDFLSCIEPFIVAAACEFSGHPQEEGFDPEGDLLPAFNVRTWSQEERSLTGIFLAVRKWYQDEGFVLVPLHITFTKFIFHPQYFFPDADDILALPLIQNNLITEANHSTVVLPSVLPTQCVCGDCVPRQEQLRHNLVGFRHQYFTIVAGAAARNCVAFKEAWEPVLQAAECWLEVLLGRIESAGEAFPWMSECRTGPKVIEIADLMDVTVGCSLTVSQLLHFTIVFRQLQSLPESADPSLRVALSLPKDALGYVIHLDDNDFLSKEILFLAQAGWLYDLSSNEFADKNGSITLLYPSDEPSVRLHNLRLSGGTMVTAYMQVTRSDFPFLLPSSHAGRPFHTIIPGDLTHWSQYNFHTTIELSSSLQDGFPQLSGKGVDILHGVAALIRISVHGRVIETPYRPDIHIGAKCKHRDQYQHMTHCSPTSSDFINSIDCPPEALAQKQRFPDESNEQWLEYRELTAHLLQSGAFLERGRLCIVRCGRQDGPAEPIVLLAASFGKRIYLIHHQECWTCAIARMQAQVCTIGIALETKSVTDPCALCQRLVPVSTTH